MDNYVYIIIAVIIGIVIGSLSCLCVYNSLNINDKPIIKGGGVINIEKTTLRHNEDLFNTLVPKLNNFGLEGHNINDYNDYQTI